VKYANIKLISVDVDYLQSYHDGAVQALREALNEGYDIIKVVTSGRDNDNLVFVVGQTHAAKELYEI